MNVNNIKHYCFLTGLYNRNDGLMYERQGKSLVEAGYKVTIVVCDSKPNELKEGINIVSTGMEFKSRHDRFLHSRKLLFEYAKEIDADIYQLSDPELLGMVSSLKKLNKTVVFNLREYYPDFLGRKSYIPYMIRGLVPFLYKNFMKYYLPQYDAVFTVTDWILDILRSEYRVQKSFLLTNFPRYNENHNFSLNDYLKRDNILCYEGTVYGVSRQENVFKALEGIPEIKYEIMGIIHPYYSYIKDHPYWKNVTFKNGFNIEDLEGLFSRATISNVFRDFGNRDGSLGVMKVFESMEAGLPVLFADVPLYRKINEMYNCGVCVDPNSVESIKEALLFLLNNKEVAYAMGQRGRHAVKEKYNWDYQAQYFISIIKQISNNE